MVDDSLIHAHDCASKGVYVLLADFGYPWNRVSPAPEEYQKSAFLERDRRRSGRI